MQNKREGASLPKLRLQTGKHRQDGSSYDAQQLKINYSLQLNKSRHEQTSHSTAVAVGLRLSWCES